MKTPSLKQCLLALVARFTNQQPPQPYNNNPVKPSVRPCSFLKPRGLVPAAQARISERLHSNQRQLRKDRRRRFAAGDRRAFN